MALLKFIHFCSNLAKVSKKCIVQESNVIIVSKNDILKKCGRWLTVAPMKLKPNDPVLTKDGIWKSPPEMNE